MQSVTPDCLFPDWNPPEYPAWINKSGRGFQVLFASRLNFLSDTVKYLQDVDAGQIVPVVLAEGCNASEARKIVGKSIWRQLHKSTEATNVKRAFLRLKHKTDWPTIMTIKPCNLRAVNKLNPLCERVLFAGQKAPPRGFRDVALMHRDTVRMGVAVNPNWSLSRLKEEHDKAALKYKVKGKCTVPFARPMICKIDGFTFTRLVSEYDIVAEGVKQRHCVGSYAGMAERGDFLLFSVDGPERATLQLSPSGHAFTVCQLRGLGNRRSSPKCRAASGKLAQFINRFGVASSALGDDPATPERG